MKKYINKLLIIFGILLTSINFSSVSAVVGDNTRAIGEILFDNENKKISFKVQEAKASDLYENGGFLGLWQSAGPLKMYLTGKINQDVTEPEEDSSWNDWISNAAKNLESMAENLLDTVSNSDTSWMLIWPNVGVNGDKIKATSADIQQANDVLSLLVNNYNTAISFVLLHTNDTSLDYLDIAKCLSKGGSEACSLGSNITTYWSYTNLKEYDKLKGTYRQGTSQSSWVRFVSDDGDELIVQWKCPNGYDTGGYLADKIYSTTPAAATITWKEIYNAANGARAYGATADSGGFDMLFEMGTVEEKMSEMSDSLTSWTSSALGFSTLEELVYNRNARAYTYYLGMMPYTWFQAASIVFWICEVVGVLILLFSVIKLIFQQNYAVISPSVRVNMQDQIANTILAIFLMVLYIPLFYIVAKTNTMLISFLDSITGGVSLVSSANVGWFVKLIMVIINLIIIVKLNIEYLTRAVMLTVMHSIAPAMIASISIQGTKGYFNIWFKEYIGSIFLQLFDAILLTIFITVCKNGVFSNYWEAALMTYMFIPLNKWFKQKFTGVNGVGQVAEQTEQGGKAMAGTIAGAGFALADGVVSGAAKGAVSGFKNGTSIGGGKIKSAIGNVGEGGGGSSEGGAGETSMISGGMQKTGSAQASSKEETFQDKQKEAVDPTITPGSIKKTVGGFEVKKGIGGAIVGGVKGGTKGVGKGVKKARKFLGRQVDSYAFNGSIEKALDKGKKGNNNTYIPNNYYPKKENENSANKPSLNNKQDSQEQSIQEQEEMERAYYDDYSEHNTPDFGDLNTANETTAEEQAMAEMQAEGLAPEVASVAESTAPEAAEVAVEAAPAAEEAAMVLA